MARPVTRTEAGQSGSATDVPPGATRSQPLDTMYAASQPAATPQSRVCDLDKGGQLPIWFLDVDGTLSPIASNWDGPTLYGARSAISVPYRQSVVDAIGRIHRTGVAEVRWLTTWEATVLQAWDDVLGTVLQPATPVHQGRGWWKARVVRAALADHPTQCVVWTDDQITPGHRRSLDRTRLLAIAPPPNRGLTSEDVERIECWARTVRQANRSPTDRSGKEEVWS